MKIRMINPPTGLFNGLPWPLAGSVFDVPDVVGDDLVRAGVASKAPLSRPTEKRPATSKEEKRKRRV